MNAHSLLPIFLVVAPFAVAFLLEAVVIYFFKFKRLLPSVGISVFVNILSLGLLYISSQLLLKLGYNFDGLRVPLQIVFAFWWLSIVMDGLLLQLFLPQVQRKTIYLASLVMNTVSYLFLFFFIANSH